MPIATLVTALACTFTLLKTAADPDLDATTQATTQPTTRELGDDGVTGEDFSLAALSIDTSYFAETSGDEFDVELFQYSAGVSVLLPLSEELIFSLGGEYRRSQYDFDNLASELPTASDGDIGGLDRYTLSIVAILPRSERTTLLALGNLSAAGDASADFGESLTFVVGGGVQYALSEQFSVTGGAVVFSRLEDDPKVLPAVGVQWTPNDRWSVSVGIPETAITYAATQDVTIFLTGDADLGDSRLSGDGVLDGAVLRDEGVGLLLGVDWRANAKTSFRLGVGSILGREIEVLDDDGDELFDENLDASVYATAGIELRL